MNVSLILEGGGVRTSFTAGVIDYFIEKSLDFPIVFTVSASSFVGINYLSKQVKRLLTPVLKKDSIDNGIKNHTLNPIDMNYLYKSLEANLRDFDFDAFKASEKLYFISLCSRTTGEAVYKNANAAKNFDQLLKFISASSSLPGISKPVKLGNDSYYDGGDVDSLPIFESIKRGYNKSVVVLTRPLKFRREYVDLTESPPKELDNYPNMKRAYGSRHIKYNNSKDMIEYLAENEEAVVLAPEKDLGLALFDKDIQSILRVYNMGYEVAKENYIQIQSLMNRSRND